MDHAREHQSYPVVESTPTGRSIAIIGAGPAGLSCAGELAKLGHTVTIFEKREMPGGLSTYGIIALREPVEIALEETKMIESLGVQPASNSVWILPCLNSNETSRPLC